MRAMQGTRVRNCVMVVRERDSEKDRLCVCAVSYTHLDVYKRQVEGRIK